MLDDDAEDGATGAEELHDEEDCPVQRFENSNAILAITVVAEELEEFDEDEDEVLDGEVEDGATGAEELHDEEDCPAQKRFENSNCSVDNRQQVFSNFFFLLIINNFFFC